MSKVQSFDSLESMCEAMAADQMAASKAAEDHPIKVGDLKHDDYVVSFRPEYGVVIFAQVIETLADEDDAACVEESRQRGYVFTKAYSTMCTYGELGDIHITRIHGKVTKAVFERAKANGWRHLDASN